MSKIDLYFKSIQRDLESRLERMRIQMTDSEAKGNAVERIVGDLLTPYLQPTRATYRRQIIDSFGGASGEVDLAFCNAGQPSIETDSLLAEGVDYALQVKSILTDTELDSLIRNGESVKRLERRLGKGDIAFAGDIAGSLLIDKVPYVAVALDSQLRFATIHERLVQKCAAIDPSLQPDALFVIGRGSCINSRSRFSSSGQPVPGWMCFEDPSDVMLELINFLLVFVPRPIRASAVLRPYLAKSSSRLKEAPPK